MSLLEQAGVTVSPAGHGTAATLCSKIMSSAIIILINSSDSAIENHHILMLGALVW